MSDKLDHRELGKLLSIFTFDEAIGAGQPIWLEKGNLLREIIISYINKLQKKHGIKLVKTPIFGTEDLYKTSGHLDHYQENIYPAINIENNKYILRPMTCPHHILLIKKQILTHQSFPITLGENAMLYRNEFSGGLLGLERVRAMELIDMHSFLLKDQIDSEIQKFCHLIFHLIELFSIQLDSITLSCRSQEKSEKFFDDPEMWKYAEEKLSTSIEQVLKSSKFKDVQYSKDIGGAAFYGPKIDFQIKTMSGKIITLSTIQLDFLLSKKFDLTYNNEKQEPCHPVIIHIGLIGTLERFIAYLLEEHQGNFPIWLAPIQVAIIPINSEKHAEVSQRLRNLLFSRGIRSEIDLSRNSTSKKIRNSQQQKIPFQILLGDKESESLDQISYKEYGGNDPIHSSMGEFIDKVEKINHILDL